MAENTHSNDVQVRRNSCNENWVLRCSVYQEENGEAALTGVGKASLLAIVLHRKRREELETSAQMNEKGIKTHEACFIQMYVTGLETEVERWLLSGPGHVTDKTVWKKAGQVLSPNPMPGIAPRSNRCCCSLREVRRASRPTSETCGIRPPGLANTNGKAWAAISNTSFFFFNTCKTINNTF